MSGGVFDLSKPGARVVASSFGGGWIIPLDALSLLSEGGQLAPLMTRTGRSRLHLEPKIQNLRPPLSEEQKAMRNAIWEAVRRNLGLETTENSDKADSD
jgi:hypothetical protein